MPLLVSLFFGFVPMFLFAALVYWLDRYEKEPRILLGAAFFWGVVIAAGGAFIINTASGMGIYMFTGSESAAEIGTASIVAPIVEEFLKGLAVAIVFFIFYKEFDSILDGIIYGAIVALGFAATENTLYIYRNGYQESGWGGLFLLVFIRVIIVGWQHPFYTAFTGIGFAVSRTNKNNADQIYCAAGWFGNSNINACLPQHLWRSHRRIGRSCRWHFRGLDRLVNHACLHHLDDLSRSATS